MKWNNAEVAFFPIPGVRQRHSAASEVVSTGGPISMMAGGSTRVTAEATGDTISAPPAMENDYDADMRRHFTIDNLILETVDVFRTLV